MPPEQSPWDRREFRKHERSASDPRFGGGGPHRWREQHHQTHAPPLPPHPQSYHHQNNHQQQQRWYTDFRSSRPVTSGHGKQGGWLMYPDDAGRGFQPFGSRYGDRNAEDDGFRPLGPRGDGRYFRNKRENRGSFSQKDWRSPSWDSTPSNGTGKPGSDINNLKSVENTETYHNNSQSNESSHPVPDLLSVQSQSQSQSLVKEKKDGTVDGLESVGEKFGREQGIGSMDWKPLKWTRSGSLSLRGSGFSHSSGSKSVGVESIEVAAEVKQKNVTPVQSPSASNVTPTISASFDETSSRKKPRLGWGEGLAKYEKKKVDGPEDGATKDGLVVTLINTETVHSASLNLSDKSPRVAGSSECVSPATPSSVACSSTPGNEEEVSPRAAHVDQNAANLSCSPNITSQMHNDGATFHLEKFDLASIAKLSSLINELLQLEDPSSVETVYLHSTSMSKLLVWKIDVLKAIEVTESKIDSLETELKLLMADSRSHCSDSSSLLPGHCQEQVAACDLTECTPLHGVPAGNVIAENLSSEMEEECEALKGVDMDSPGSAAIEIVEVPSSDEDTCRSGRAECAEGFVKLESNNSINLNLTSLENAHCNEVCRADVPKPIMGGHFENDATGNMHCDVDYIDSILACNKDTANGALEELNKLLPSQRYVLDVSTASFVLHDSSSFKEKFIFRKQSHKFKEKVIVLRFKVFQHFWKEGRVVSVRKLRGKTHKMFNTTHSGYKKNRSSNWSSRISYVAGSHQIVPAEEVIKFIDGLLAESRFKLRRKTSKMPPLILDQEVKLSRFISNNGLVEDPLAVEREKSMINPWTAEEREIFIDKLAGFGKDFMKIASFLEHKTIADCIEFYYKNHKSECFERARKKPETKSQPTTYLVAPGKRWNREVNATSLDILGKASAIASNASEGIGIQQKFTPRVFLGASGYQQAARGDNSPLQRINSLDMYSNETVAADVLAGICGSLSSEAMSSCITSSFDHADGHLDWKAPRFSSGAKRPLTPDVTQNVDDECSDESCGEMDPSDWTDEEKSIFVQAVSSYGKDFVMISQLVRTRSMDQCKIFYSKARKCLGLDQIHPGAWSALAPNANGGGSDIEDGCVVQAGSIACNGDSKCMREGLPHDPKASHVYDMAGTNSFEPDVRICEENIGPVALDSLTGKEPVLRSSSMGDKPAGSCNSARDKQNGTCGSEQEGRTFDVLAHTGSVRVAEDNNCSWPNGINEAGSDGHHLEGNKGRDHRFPEDNLNSDKIDDRDAAMCCAVSETKFEPPLAVNVLKASVSARPSIQVESCTEKEVPVENGSEKSCVISFDQNGHHASVESSILFPVPVKYQRYSRNNAPETVGLNRTDGKHSEESITTADCQRQPLSGNSLLDSVNSTQILRGYPVTPHTVKEIGGNVDSKRHAFRSGHDLPTSFAFQKCTTSSEPPLNKVIQVPFPPQEPSSSDKSTHASVYSSEEDKPSRNGDLKLFGKILMPSQQKPNSCVQEIDRKASHQSLNLQLGADPKASFDCEKHLGSKSMPGGGYSSQGGSKSQMQIQTKTTDFPPLPDSSLFVTKYPTAFSNHSTSTPAQLHGIVGSNDSVFSSRETSSSNYQVSGNQELEPFALEMKKSQDALFSEIPRRNRFDVVQGLQHQDRGILGINVAGSTRGVSDPVTAIKVQYAKAQNVENDTWRSNDEDVGR